MNIKTLVLILVFAFGYVAFILKKMADSKLDLYDFVMLSAVALIPAVFVIFPHITNLLSLVVGVEFPFVVMFGMIFFFIFIFVYRITVKLHGLESEVRKLVQEVGILKQLLGEKID